MPHRDPEKRRAYGREWIRNNAERAREAMRKWRAAHPEEHNAERRDFYARHREALLAQSSQYHKEHPEVGLASGHNYRARKYAAEGSFTPAQWLEVVAFYGGRCAYCGELRALEPDHRTPLTRGGSNRIENILPACHPCNARKHTLTEDEFRARLASERDKNLQSD